MSCFLIKLSIGLGYLRILKLRYLDPRWERVVCYTVIIVSSAANLQAFFYILFQCAGHGFMAQDVPFATVTGQCPGANHGGLISTYVQSVTNMVVDWILVLVPSPSVVGAIMDRKTRLS